jgi:hypothetical protein
MPPSDVLSPAEIEELDRFYREGGLRAMASPHVHYEDATCPHPGCDHAMEWIDFGLELPATRRAFISRGPRLVGWDRLHRSLSGVPELDPVYHVADGTDRRNTGRRPAQPAGELARGCSVRLKLRPDGRGGPASLW